MKSSILWKIWRISALGQIKKSINNLIFIYFFKYETIVHWVPAFFMHNKSFLGGVILLQCNDMRIK